ncbi:uncharacterized protein V6R79_020901 [Siganus canaliculatus]
MAVNDKRSTLWLIFQHTASGNTAECGLYRQSCLTAAARIHVKPPEQAAAAGVAATDKDQKSLVVRSPVYTCRKTVNVDTPNSKHDLAADVCL